MRTTAGNRAAVEPGLGRVEPWLRGLGGCIWAFVGLERWVLAPPGAFGPWVYAWAVFGVAYGASALHQRMPKPLAVGLLVLQTASVTAFPHLGLKEFEGLLMSVVLAQVPTVLPLRAAVAWAVLQWAPLFYAVTPLGTRSGPDIFAAYSAFAVFTLLLYFLHGREQRARQAAAEANAELLAARALVAERTRESERVRISRELHDSLGHHLTALRIQLDLASRMASGQAQEPLSRAQEVARDALAEVRRVVGEMQKPEGFDFAAALRALSASVPSPRIHVEDALPVISDPACAHTLFRCVQEAITNGVRHAGARNIWVGSRTVGDALELSVRDDGKGAGELVAGNGLKGMRERLVEVGGTLELDGGSPGRGFEVRLRVPLERTKA